MAGGRTAALETYRLPLNDEPSSLDGLQHRRFNTWSPEVSADDGPRIVAAALRMFMKGGYGVSR